MEESGPTDRIHAELLHELRGPWTILLGRIQLIRRALRAGEEPPNLADQLETMEGAVIRLAAAVERVDDRDPRL